MTYHSIDMPTRVEYGVYDSKDNYLCVFVGDIHQVQNWLKFDSQRNVYRGISKKQKFKRRYYIERVDNNMFEKIQRRLLGGQTSDYDKATFERFHKKKISIDECVEEFKEHNGIGDEIDTQEFEMWLNSLGYR